MHLKPFRLDGISEALQTPRRSFTAGLQDPASGASGHRDRFGPKFLSNYLTIWLLSTNTTFLALLYGIGAFCPWHPHCPSLAGSRNLISQRAGCFASQLSPSCPFSRSQSPSPACRAQPHKQLPTAAEQPPFQLPRCRGCASCVVSTQHLNVTSNGIEPI